MSQFDAEVNIISLFSRINIFHSSAKGDVRWLGALEEEFVRKIGQETSRLRNSQTISTYVKRSTSILFNHWAA